MITAQSIKAPFAGFKDFCMEAEGESIKEGIQ